MTGFDTDELTAKFFESFWNRYQVGLEQSVKGKEIMFDYSWITLKIQ